MPQFKSHDEGYVSFALFRCSGLGLTRCTILPDPGTFINLPPRREVFSTPVLSVQSRLAGSNSGRWLRSNRETSNITSPSLRPNSSHLVPTAVGKCSPSMQRTRLSQCRSLAWRCSMHKSSPQLGATSSASYPSNTASWPEPCGLPWTTRMACRLRGPQLPALAR